MSKIFEALEEASRSKSLSGDVALLRSDVTMVDRAPPELVVVNQPGSHTAESFRFLRAKIIRPASGPVPRTIVVTSALMGEGKTYVASNLAAAISMGIEESVLLVDADLRRSAIHHMFGMPFSRKGLSTYLAESAALSDLLHKTAVDKLTILPAGNSTEIPAELLSSERMRALIRELRDRYANRFVIIDTPPVELTPEAAVIANEVDGVLFVVHYGVTPRHAVKSALDKLQKEKVLGIVFNGYNKTKKFYDEYGYHKYAYRKKKK